MKQLKSLEKLALIMWDGLGFFSFDLKKIPRLREEAIKWSDKFTDPFDTTVLVLTFVLMYFVSVPVILRYVTNEEKT